MSATVDHYFETLIELLRRVRDTQGASIGRAAEACARSIASNKLVFTFGADYGALPAIEMFPRTGTIVGFLAIVESTMIAFHRVWGDMGARQRRFVEAAEGYGKAILSSHELDPADSIILFSHLGVSAVILDVALGAREKGLTVIGVTSLAHSLSSPSHHSSGTRLFEVADVVIDTGASLADASIRIEGLDAPVGAHSTNIAIGIAHAIVAATAEKLVRRGVQPFVMLNPDAADRESANAANDHNYDELWRRLRAR